MTQQALIFIAITSLLAVHSATGAEQPFVFTGVESHTASSPAHSAALAQPEGLGSWPVSIGENFSSPMFYDLDGDGRMEIITTDRTNTYVFDSGANLLPGWPRYGGSDNVPAVADIDEDGPPEIFVASPGGPPKIRCFNVDGTSQAGFPVNMPWQNWLNVSAPAVADVDGDGHLDVGAQSEPGVAFFDRFGQPLPGWPYLWTTTQNIVWSAPAVADLDADGLAEVVVGNNCLYNYSVHVIRSSGAAMPGWPVSTNNIFASAAVGDLDADGDLEIVIQEGDPTWYGNQMHVWHHDGTYLPGWPREIAPQWESSRSNPAIADVDNDGTPEIVTHTGDGMLHVIRADGNELLGYPRLVPGGGSISSVQVLDIDANGLEEFFLCYWAGGSQWVSGWTFGGATLAGFPKLLFTGSQLSAHSSACFADLEGDGDLDLCAQGQTFGAGRVWVYEVDGSVFNPESSRCDWPKIRHDERNTGLFERFDPTGITEALDVPGGIVCYPNPAPLGDQIWLRLPGGTGAELSLYSPAGRRMGHSRLNSRDSASVVLNDLLGPNPRAGVYFIRITRPGKSAEPATRLVLLDER